LSADGRVRVLVGVLVGPSSESWANPPGTTTADPLLAAAAGRGMSMWNAATDASGNRTNYYFDTISGTQPPSSVDIIIVKGPKRDATGVESPVAQMETGGGRPYKLIVREDMLTKMSPSDLGGLFAHELGHRIGLSNKNCAGTIMQRADEQPDGTFKMRQATVGAQDVHMSRINYNAATTSSRFHWTTGRRGGATGTATSSATARRCTVRTTPTSGAGHTTCSFAAVNNL